MRKASIGAILALLFGSFALGDVQADKIALTATGVAGYFVNAYGAETTTFTEIPSGTISGVSNTIQGCMYGASGIADGSLCASASDTYTGTTQAIRPVTFSYAYDYFWVTGTWTGSGTWTIKMKAVTSGGGSGGGSGGNVTVVNPLDGSGYVEVNCKVNCAGGSSTPADSFANPTGAAGLNISFGALWNGSTWDRWYGDKTNGGWVNIKNSVSLPVTGTFWQTTQPVSGTFWQTTQPVSGTFWQTTQPVSNGGTFAVQAAQSGTWNVANTGTFAVQSAQSGTWTVQPGNTPNTTPWLTTDSSDMSGTTPGTAPGKSNVVAGIYNSSAPSPTTGQTLPFQLDSSGRLIVDVGAGSSGNAAASATGSSVPADADYNGLNVSGTLRGQTGVNPTGSVYAGQTDLSSVNGVSLGSPSAYGTAPTGNVPGVNAFVTNVNANGSAVSASSAPVVIASDQAAVAIKYGSGIFEVAPTGSANTAANPFFFEPSDGTSGMGAMANFGTAPGAVKALNSNSNTFIAGVAAAAASSGVQKVGFVGNAGAAVDQAPGSAVPANAVQAGYTDGTNTRVPYLDPCGFSAWTYYPISVSANTQIVAGSSSKNVYVCHFFLAPVAAAANVNIVESATSNNACATSPTGMMGGATAALGAQLAANYGFVLPEPAGRAVMKTATAADAVCIFASAQVTGVLAYVQF